MQQILHILLAAGALFACLLLRFLGTPLLYSILACIMAVYLTARLIKYTDRTRRHVIQFLEAIQYEDFSQVFSPGNAPLEQKELYTSFNAVLKKFQQTRAETEAQYRYLQTIVQHIGIGLISFTDSGRVEIMNSAAKKLLQIHHLHYVEELEDVYPSLAHDLINIKRGTNRLIKIQQQDHLLQIMMYGTEFILLGEKHKLVSLQNIQSELEEKEMEAWQNLIRVLTHEIMNSITPIASMASTAEAMIQDAPKKNVTADTLQDIKQALETIERRSNGLLKFVQSYRKLTRLPAPDFQIIPVVDMFTRIQILMQETAAEKGINLSCIVDPETLEITADPNMIEQVLINLINNAVDAVSTKNKPAIVLRALMNSQGRPCIQVQDNGIGILEEVQSRIFIPFFSTKKSGTGIGLSLARQIMRMHSGSIQVQSELNEKTVFTLSF